jgi:hypothetical protein
MRLACGTATAAVAILATSAGLAGCSGDDDDADSPRAAETQRKEPEKPKELTIAAIDRDGSTIHAKSVVLVGRVSEPGATVHVGEKDVVAKADGTFEARVRLKVGENPIGIDASKPGLESASRTVWVTRALTARERAARAQRRRQRREAALAELKATAQQLDPKLFQKDPDRYAGQKVVMTGQIFQIQEGGDNFFLMDTLCSTDYDITVCDGPTVYVTYDFRTDKTEDDLVTVYGTVVGGFEYDTQIGGSNYVGHISARVIE